jgi:hypothetical protein
LHLRISEKRVLRKTFGPKWDMITGTGANWKTRSFIICMLYQKLEKNEMYGACGIYERGEGF